MKKQDLLKFTAKMLLFTRASALPGDGDDPVHENEMVREFRLTTKNNNDLMKEWLESRAVIVDSRTQLKEMIDVLQIINVKSSSDYQSKREIMAGTRKMNEEKEYEYNTQNAFILYEQYFNF